MLRKCKTFQMKPHLPPKASPKPVDIFHIRFSISQFPADAKIQNKSLKAFLHRWNHCFQLLPQLYLHWQSAHQNSLQQNAKDFHFKYLAEHYKQIKYLMDRRTAEAGDEFQRDSSLTCHPSTPVVAGNSHEVSTRPSYVSSNLLLLASPFLMIKGCH